MNKTRLEDLKKKCFVLDEDLKNIAVINENVMEGLYEKNKELLRAVNNMKLICENIIDILLNENE